MRVFVSGCERCFLSLTAAVPADAGTSDSGPLVFDRQGHFTRIAAVRKDGYVSCDCSNNPQCGPGTESCRHTIENCCDNPEGRWNLCAYTDRWPGVDVAAPFELNVNGEQLIVQNAYNEAPVAAGRPCTSEVAMTGLWSANWTLLRRCLTPWCSPGTKVDAASPRATTAARSLSMSSVRGHGPHRVS